MNGSEFICHCNRERVLTDLTEVTGETKVRLIRRLLCKNLVVSGRSFAGAIQNLAEGGLRCVPIDVEDEGSLSLR